MSYQCEKCQESSTLGDTVNTVIKIGTFVGIAYLAFSFRSQIKDVVGQAIAKGQKHLTGPPVRKGKKHKVAFSKMTS